MSLIRLYFRAIGLLQEKWLAALLGLASVVVAVILMAEPMLFGWAVEALTTEASAVSYIVLWALLGVGGIVANVVIAYWADRMAHRNRLAAMACFFEHATTLPVVFHAQTQSGRLLKIMLAGTDRLFGLWLSLLREHLIAVFSLVVLIPTALWLNWRLAVLLLGLMVVYAVASSVVFRRTQGGQQAIQTQHSDLTGHAADVMSNILVVQSFLRVPAELAALRRSMSRLLDAQYPILTWWAVLNVLTRAASTITIVSIFALGAWLHGRGLAGIGAIIAFVGFAQGLIGRLDQLMGFASSLFFDLPAIREYFDVLDETPGIVEKPGAKPLEPVRGHVVFERVSYRYPGGGGVFDLSFEARPGQTVALVGPTGSGKTTALALLQRVRDPDHGRILIDGCDIRDVTLASLRHAISVVFQDAGLFNRSIAENIRVGRADATDAEVEAAARLAEAHEFITRKADGYAALAGERGSNLSGGERQRIAIARGILKNAPILILDEATSALDVETETRVQRALNALRRGATTFMIAHRLSTVRNADLILVLSEGCIVERGSFAELARAGGPFARLVAEGGLKLDEGPEVPAGAGLAA